MEDKQIAVCKDCSRVLAKGDKLVDNSMYCLDCSIFPADIEVYLLEWRVAVNYSVGDKTDEDIDGKRLQ